MQDGFVFLDEVLSGVRWDAKYATWDNFTGAPVDGYQANRIVGSLALAEGLLRAKVRAAALGFGLLLWDGYRPQRAVNRFLEWSAQAEDGRTKSRFYPNIDRGATFTNGYVASRSGHSRGGAVDLTLYRLDTGELAPMGGGHDLMDARSHHGAPGLSRVAAHHRRRLCSIMEASGFAPYDCEWWHYVLRDEPYPDTYFDFPIASRAVLVYAIRIGLDAPGRMCEVGAVAPIRRLALLSDVHGNRVALDAVLTDLAHQAPVDEVWALGDLVAIGPDPVGVLERLHRLPNCRFLAGNTERYVRTGNRPLPDPETAASRPHLPGLIAGFSWTAGRLHEAGWFDWLTALPASLRGELATGEQIVGVHATPDRDDGSGIHPLLSDDELEQLLDLAAADILCAGHTHFPFIGRVGQRAAVNLGSVSNPPQHGDGSASYVVIDATGPTADIRHRSVEYDMRAVLEQLLDLRHPALGFIEDDYFNRHLDGH